MQDFLQCTVAEHYDKLIEEQNDPVWDPPILQEYMNLWDGTPFFALMQLGPQKTVLEIGVGTGRLAMRVIPQCKQFVGVDLSEKTIQRARENLVAFQTHTLLCADFLELDFGLFDVIYASLTWFHIAEKQDAIAKVAHMLNREGRFVLSISKDQATRLYCNGRKLVLYPDSLAATEQAMQIAGLRVVEKIETEFAWLYAAQLKQMDLSQR